MQIAEFSSLPRSRFLAGKELHLTSLKTRLRGMFGVLGIKAQYLITVSNCVNSVTKDSCHVNTLLLSSTKRMVNVC